MNEQMLVAKQEMKEIRNAYKLQKKIYNLKKNNEKMCAECHSTMVHIVSRVCTCHRQNCSKYKTTSSCTIFRKITKLQNPTSMKN